MRIRHITGKGPEKLELQMTPLIDIVFQMLAFFIMTLKIVAIEGDFSVKMPAPTPSQGTTVDEQLPVSLTVRLRADEAGELAAIEFNEQAFPSFGELNKVLMSVVGKETGPGSLRETAEIELDFDDQLRYEFIIRAITAVSGYVTADGQTVKLIEKIRFAPSRG